MTDTFAAYPPNLRDPAPNATAVTPGVGALGFVTRAVYAGAGGDIAVTMVSGNTVTFAGVPAGAILPIRATHILSAGTTATGIVALW